MDRISAPAIASMLLTAPAWARVGLTVRSERIRLDAARALAQVIVDGISGEPEQHPDQLKLELTPL